MFLMFLFTLPIHADNKDVKDTAGVLDNQVQNYIKRVNDDQLEKIKGHPQIAVYTVSDLEGNDLDDYAQQLFDKYKFGTKGYDNGVLLLIAVNDHKVRMQTGYGIESAVPDQFVNQLMDPMVQEDFRENNYSTGTKLMVDRLVKQIQTHQSELRSKSAVNTHQAIILKQQQEAAKEAKKAGDFAMGLLVAGLALLGAGYLARYGLQYLRNEKIERQLLKEYEAVVNKVNKKLVEQGLKKYKIDNHLLESEINKLKTQVANHLTKTVDFNAEITDYIRKNYLGELTSYANLFALDHILKGQKVYLLDGTYDSFEAIKLLNLPKMQAPLVDYQSLAQRIADYVISSGAVLEMIDHLTQDDYDRFVNDVHQYIDARRQLWPELSDDDVNSAYIVNDGLKLVDYDLADYKSNLKDLFESMNEFGKNFDKYLSGHGLSAEALFKSLKSKYFSQYVVSIKDTLDDLDTEKHLKRINDEFAQRMGRTNLVDSLSSDKLDVIDRLAPSDKEKALKKKDDAKFNTAAALAAASMAADESSYARKHRDEYNDDDYNSWFGSSSYYGGSDDWSGGDSWSDGGSFGGDGGFSGGGGGDAGW